MLHSFPAAAAAMAAAGVSVACVCVCVEVEFYLQHLVCAAIDAQFRDACFCT